MNNNHLRKSILNVLSGLLLTTGGIFGIIYFAIKKSGHNDWIFWAIMSSLIINAGLLFIGSAIVHKVKADLIRRQRKSNVRTEKTTVD